MTKAASDYFAYISFGSDNETPDRFSYTEDIKTRQKRLTGEIRFYFRDEVFDKKQPYLFYASDKEILLEEALPKLNVYLNRKYEAESREEFKTKRTKYINSDEINHFLPYIKETENEIKNKEQYYELFKQNDQENKRKYLLSIRETKQIHIYQSCLYVLLWLHIWEQNYHQILMLLFSFKRRII